MSIDLTVFVRKSKNIINVVNGCNRLVGTIEDTTGSGFSKDPALDSKGRFVIRALHGEAVGTEFTQKNITEATAMGSVICMHHNNHVGYEVGELVEPEDG